jgi:hypothetical protein
MTTGDRRGHAPFPPPDNTDKTAGPRMNPGKLKRPKPETIRIVRLLKFAAMVNWPPYSISKKHGFSGCTRRGKPNKEATAQNKRRASCKRGEHPYSAPQQKLLLPAMPSRLLKE